MLLGHSIIKCNEGKFFHNVGKYATPANETLLVCLFNDLSKEDVGNLEKFIRVCISTLIMRQVRKDILEVIIYHLWIRNYLRQ